MKTRVYSASFFLFLVLVLGLSACQSLRAPSMSGDPAKMSSDTLCFRYANNKAPELAAEIDRRNLDCASILREDPLLTQGRGELEAAHRIGR